MNWPDGGRWYMPFCVRTSDGEIRETFQGYFFRMAGTCQYSNIFGWNAVFFCEVLRYDQIVIGYDSFYSSNDEFIPYPRFQLLQVNFEIGGGGDKYQRIRLFHYIVDIRAEVDALHVK